jgi:hypothetical protein
MSSEHVQGKQKRRVLCIHGRKISDERNDNCCRPQERSAPVVSIVCEPWRRNAQNSTISAQSSEICAHYRKSTLSMALSNQLNIGAMRAHNKISIFRLSRCQRAILCVSASASSSTREGLEPPYARCTYHNKSMASRCSAILMIADCVEY